MQSLPLSRRSKSIAPNEVATLIDRSGVFPLTCAMAPTGDDPAGPGSELPHPGSSSPGTPNPGSSSPDARSGPPVPPPVASGAGPEKSPSEGAPRSGPPLDSDGGGGDGDGGGEGEGDGGGDGGGEEENGDGIADGQWKSVRPESITVHRIGAVIRLLILGGIAMVLVTLGLLFGWFTGWWRWGVGGAGAGLILWLLWLTIWYPTLWYRNLRYRITGGGVEIRRGVWWRHIANVPHSRVQHTDVTQGPIDRYFGLGTLLIHTAGTHNHTIDLSGLGHDRAMVIRNFLLEESARQSPSQPGDPSVSASGGADEPEGRVPSGDQPGEASDRVSGPATGEATDETTGEVTDHAPSFGDDRNDPHRAPESPRRSEHRDEPTA